MKLSWGMCLQFWHMNTFVKKTHIWATTPTIFFKNISFSQRRGLHELNQVWDHHQNTSNSRSSNQNCFIWVAKVSKKPWNNSLWWAISKMTFIRHSRLVFARRKNFIYKFKEFLQFPNCFIPINSWFFIFNK